MKQVIKYAVFALFFFGLSFFSAGPLFAQTNTNTNTPSNTNSTTTPAAPVDNNIANNVCKGVLITEKDATVNQNTTVASCKESGDESFSYLIKRIINIFSIVVGAVSVIMIIIGGFRYIISGGDSSGVSGAKNTILYAIVGLVIVIFAQVIVRFVLTNISP